MKLFKYIGLCVLLVLATTSCCRIRIGRSICCIRVTIIEYNRRLLQIVNKNILLTCL